MTTGTIDVAESGAPSAGPNSKAALAERVRAGQISWAWPLVMTFIRFPLLLVGQGLVSVGFALAGHATPWSAAADLYFFYVPPIVDLGCLLLLIWLTRRKGLRLRDLIGFDRGRLGRDMLIALGLFVPYMAVGIVGQMLGGLIVYGSPLPPPPPYTPPLWVAWWSALVFPLTVAFVEEMTYRGYVLPRLEALMGRSWPALLTMTLGFAVQHLAMPLLDWRYSLSFSLMALPMGLVMGLIYRKQRRLLPLIAVHWGAGLAINGLLVLLPMLTGTG